MTKTKIAEMVQRYFDDVRLDGDIYFVVDEAHILTGDNWVRVPVRPSHLPEKLYRFYEILAEVEYEIREKENFAVLLLTGDPLNEEETETLAHVA